MSYSQNPYYGNASQSGGGGFLNESPGKDTPGGTKSFKGSSSVKAVTVKRLLHDVSQKHSDAEFEMDGVELSAVRLVAQIRSIKIQTTNVVFFLSDGTGSIEGRAWKDPASDPEGEDEMNKSEGLVDDVYVVVVGSLKTMNNKRHIHVISIHPTTSSEEVLNHAVHVMVDKARHAFGPGGANGTRDVEMRTSTPLRTTASDGYRPTAMETDDQFSGLPDIDRRVIHVIKDMRNSGNFPDGVPMGAIARSLLAYGTESEIFESLERLMDDGQVYSTIDETHFDVAT